MRRCFFATLFLVGCIDTTGLNKGGDGSESADLLSPVMDLSGTNVDVAGMGTDSSVSNPDLIVVADLSMPAMPVDLAGADLTGMDITMPPIVDMAATSDMAMKGPVVITGTFHAGAIEGTGSNGVAVRLQFNWHGAIAGTANGITLTGSFR